MPSLPPPRAIAAWLVPLALYALLFPVLTMLAVFVGGVLIDVSFSTLSQAPLLLSILYWAARFGDVDSSTGAAGAIDEGPQIQKTTRNYTLAGRSRFNRLTSADGFGVSPYTLYFIGLFLASLLVYMGIGS